jgi:hypothetical protein
MSRRPRSGPRNGAPMLRVNPGAFVLAHVVSRPVGPGRSVTRRPGEGFRPSQLAFGTWRLAPGAAQRFRGRSCSRSACTAPEPPSPAAAAGVRIGATRGRSPRGGATTQHAGLRVCLRWATTATSWRPSSWLDGYPAASGRIQPASWQRSSSGSRLAVCSDRAGFSRSGSPKDAKVTGGDAWWWWWWW